MRLPLWGVVWAIWGFNLAGLIVFFLVAEGLALFRKLPGDTLSEMVWTLRNNKHWLYYVILDVWFLAAVALAWSAWHFRHDGLP